MSYKNFKINDFCLVTDFVANGSFKSLRDNVKYLDEKDYALLVRLIDFTRNWKSPLKYVSEKTYKFLRHSKLQVGDLIMSNVGFPGIVFIVPDLGMPMTLGPNTILIRPNKNIAYTKYLYHYFQSQTGKEKINNITSATTLKKFNKTAFRNLKISLPPLKDQMRIAKILDKTNNLAHLRERFNTKLDELVHSIFFEMFGDPIENKKKWQLKSLGDVLNLITYGLTVRPDYVSNGVPLISAREIRSGFVDVQNGPKISMYDYNNLSKKSKPVLGDILFSKTGSIGHCAVVDANKQIAISQNTARLSFVKNIVNFTFALNYLKSRSIQKLAKRSARGNAVKDLQLGVMKKFPFPLPPLSLQKEFAKQVIKIEQLKTSCVLALDKHNLLFSSLKKKIYLQ